ncbi:MAG TPA: ribosome silencing factor [Vicinamibacterales bacterium]|nr:ribosome silencing factor [Vicinamibacterales bacterium]
MAKAERRPRKRTPAEPRLPAEITLAVAAALDKKAEDVVVLDLRKGSAFTDFFVIATGTNIRQVQTIADAINDALRRAGTRPALVEGYERGEWVLVDYFDFIVHVFMPATRQFYGLERLWGDAERIEIPA